ncbi:MAG: hypothetical protein KAT43_02515 [Nanoarchaeota archaeon]|nr:hypothetical protein [Nanoarchaeota archaeon]
MSAILELTVPVTREKPIDLYADPSIRATSPENLNLIRKIKDIYIAAHNLGDEEFNVIMDLREKGFDVNELQELGLLRFVSNSGYRPMIRENILARCEPEDMVGVVIEFNGSRYRIASYSNGPLNPDAKVRVVRSNRTLMGLGAFKETSMTVGPLSKNPENGLELIALILEQQGQLPKRA